MMHDPFWYEIAAGCAIWLFAVWVIVRSNHYVMQDDKIANGNLIAAAPELLEVLEGAHQQMQMAYECVENGRYDEALLHLGALSRKRIEVIEKAKGEEG